MKKRSSLQKCSYHLILLFSLCQTLQAAEQATISASPDSPPPCVASPEPPPDLLRSEVYKGMPFQPSEESRYILKYGILRVHVGYGFLRVQAPTKYAVAVSKKDDKWIEESRWHRVFAAEAFTGDWYRMIFAGHDHLQSFSRPWDSGVTKFYISQDEEKPFVRRYHAEKWLDFNHVNCQVSERVVDHKKKKEKTEVHFLQPGAIDALGALYKLRTFNFELNKTERFMVYTSEKNWWLEATPLAVEEVKTSIGTFKAHKVRSCSSADDCSSGSPWSIRIGSWSRSKGK
jgi:hypothetical protein